MYEITIERTFPAAHTIRLPDGSWEPVHGHNWTLQITVARDDLDEIETVMDFHALERILDPILEPMTNRHLNEVEPFNEGRVNPTAERVAWWVGTQAAEQLPAEVRLVQASVTEAPGCTATWKPDPHV